MMSGHLNLNGCKKRRRGERVFKFKTFGEKGCPAEFNGSFQENVRTLLEFGQPEIGGTTASWSFQMEVRRNPLLHVFLSVVEEPIEVSRQLHCRHCQYIGWGHHLICNKNYHFVLPMYKTNAIELQGEAHSMHGVIHSNGFGHLLRINGSEAGSELLGQQIMDFWDRLCFGLGARKVSLKDTAKKKGMHLGLIHSVAYGKPWFGHWDYVFGRGSFGVNQETYQNAVKTTQTIPLTLLAQHHHHQQQQQQQQLIGFKSYENDLKILISRYQALSGHSLITLGDLFSFMLDLKSQLPKEILSANFKYSGIMSDSSCRWSPKRVATAIHVVVEALKRAEYRWVSRQHVRDVARVYIGDTGLLDFVLKSLGNHVVGKYFVRRCLNPVTKVLEYCLEDVTNTSPTQDAFSTPSIDSRQLKITCAQLMEDMLYLVRNIFLRDQKTITSIDSTKENGVFATIQAASRLILDSKHLVKEYTICDDTNVHCRVTFGKMATPYHSFKLTNKATFAELKSKVETVFQETYFGLGSFCAQSIKNLNPQDSDLVLATVKPGSKIAFEGTYGEELTRIVMNDCVVDCICGTKDDDGERMVCCDICLVWQHIRCVQIPDNEKTPNIFLCSSCEQGMLSLPILHF